MYKNCSHNLYCCQVTREVKLINFKLTDFHGYQTNNKENALISQTMQYLYLRAVVREIRAGAQRWGSADLLHTNIIGRLGEGLNGVKR